MKTSSDDILAQNTQYSLTTLITAQVKFKRQLVKYIGCFVA